MSDIAVFDCMIYLQTASRPQRTHGCLEAVCRDDLTLYLSPEILAEVSDVLTRPELHRQFPALTSEAVKTFIAYLLEIAVLIYDVPGIYALPRDP